MICVVIGRSRHKMVLAEMQEAVKRGAQMIELRLDFISRTPDLKRLLSGKQCPLVATVRRPADGGRWSNTEEARIRLLKEAVLAGFDYVDLETDIAGNVRRFGKVQRIVSYHNTQEVPPDLEEIYAKMCKQDADVLKVCVAAQAPADNLRVLNLLKNAPKPTVAFCMGELGVPSRLLAAKFGAPFIYGAFNKDYRVAPGILSYDELTKIYFADRVNADTHIFGVIGDPVAHSLSPAIHNAAFRVQGLNCLYLPFQVPRGQLPAFLKAYDALPVRGYSVTIPHKEAAAQLAHRKDEAVTTTHSANTLIRTKEGFSAYTTDYAAAHDSLIAIMPPDSDGTPMTLEKRLVLILGAGGVARAVAHALHKAGALVAITNRTNERAKALATEIQGRVIDWNARHSALCDILINCTSVGMHPNVDDTPLHPSYLKPGLTVLDTVYTPETTLLVKEARLRGCHVQTGVDMFVRQAALQFKLFTGRDAPMDVMRKVVKRALSPVTVKAVEEEEDRQDAERANANSEDSEDPDPAED
jgi:3-dehydroquinate dehydratase/shikimate dehydrogenase